MPNSSNLEIAMRIHAQTDGKKDVDALGESLSNLGGDTSTLKEFEADLAVLTEDVHKSGTAAQGAATNVKGIGTASEEAARRSVPATKRIGEGVESISVKLSDLQKAVLTYLGVTNFGPMIKGVADTADEYKNLSARIRLVTGDGAAFDSALAGVQRVALQTNSALVSTADLFSRIYAAGKNLKMTSDQALSLTQTINQAIQVSGASAESADAATVQLIQGLQSGVLRGDEFNSVMEQSPRLAKAMADGLGITTGKLRDMANAGGLTTQVVLQALQSQGRTIEAEYAKMPETIGRALTQLHNQWTVYVGQVDAGTGASANAAKAISLLANNLDSVVSAIESAGKAWIAYRAWHIADEFLVISKAAQQAAAAKIKDTDATIADTAATIANTAAQKDAALARSGAAAASANIAGGIGKLSGALSMIKGFSLAALFTNLPEIGTWIGETTAKLTGYGKVIRDNEARLRGHEEAARAAAAQIAELAAKQKMATNAALGLNDVSQKVIDTFNESKKSGKAVAEMLDEVAKALQLSDISGIKNAGAALDALALRGDLSARQVEQAWSQALQGKDLQVFLTQANAAFDGTAQGARRMASATEAAISEALRRSGKDTLELTTGVGAAAQSAINDVDLLVEHLTDLKSRGVNVSEALTGVLDKATEAAKTDAAIDEVIARFQKLGDQGLISGDKLREGLEKAQRKAEDLKSGINDVDEAFRQLGMKGPTELKAAADKAKESFDIIKASGKASASDLREAFKRYAEAAIAANGGVASETLKAQASMYGLKINADAAGRSIVAIDPSALNDVANGADTAAKNLNRATTASDALNQSLQKKPQRVGNDLSGTGAQPDGLTPQQMRDAGWSATQIDDYQNNRKGDQKPGMVTRSGHVDTVDNKQLGRDAGVSEANLDKFSERLSQVMGTHMKQLNDGFQIGTPEEYSKRFASKFQDAVREAATYAQHSETAPTKTYKIDWTIDGQKVNLVAGSQSDAETVVKALTKAKGTSVS
jgi:tape measure domain-containing protein